MLQSARTTYAISAEACADSTLSSAKLRETSLPVGKRVRFAHKALDRDIQGRGGKRCWIGAAVMNTRICWPVAAVRCSAGQCPIAAAADADVRPHHRYQRKGRRVRQGTDP